MIDFESTSFGDPAHPTLRVTKVKSNGVDRMTLTYRSVAPYELSTVQSGDGRRTVTYAFNANKELTDVEFPAVQLGDRKDGQPSGGTWSPRTHYTYLNFSTPSCPTCSAPDQHKLETVVERHYDPLIGGNPSDKTVLINQYANPVGGAGNFEYMRVNAQCFFKVYCDDWTADLKYEFGEERPCESGASCAGNGYPGKVYIYDHRKGTSQGVREWHTYSGGWLQSIREDAMGLNRQTRYHYRQFARPGSDPLPATLLDRVDYADGTCVTKEYGLAADAWQVSEERRKSTASCQGSAGAPPDAVTRYTYDPCRGLLKTVTGPEAFPTGVVPTEDFNIGVALSFPYALSTTEITYDFEQYPVNILPECQEWGLGVPAQADDANLDPADNTDTYGNVVRTRRFPDQASVLQGSQRSQPGGRPIWKRGPDGVSTLYAYYSGGPTTWHWWSPDGSGGSATGAGPLARVVVRDKTATGVPDIGQSRSSDLVTRYAWSQDGWRVAVSDPAGVRDESTLDSDGAVLEDRVCAPPLNDAVCTVAAGSKLLRYTRHTRDLLGREVRSATYDPATSTTTPVAAVWTTYDDRGNPATVTIDPDPTAVPGNADPNPNAAPLHLLSKTFYDGADRPIKTVSPEGRVVSFAYDDLDRMTTETHYDSLDPGGSNLPTTTGSVTIGRQFDAMDRLHRLTDARGNKTYTWFDGFGRVQFVADGKPTGALAPVLLGETADQGPAGWYADTLYDVAGKLLRKRFNGRNGRGGTGFLRVEWLEYDALRRPTQQRTALTAADFVAAGTAGLSSAPADDPGGTRIASSQTHYDAYGKPDFTTDAKGRITTMQYDGFGRRSAVLGPAVDGHRDTTEIRFDAYGRADLTTRTAYDPASAAHAQRAKREFDAWGRVSQVWGDPTSDGGTVNALTTVHYDALSRITQQVQRWQTSGADDAGDRVTTRQYDAAGRTVATAVRSQASPEVFATTTYAYDRDGLMTRMTDANNNATDWEYSNMSQGDGVFVHGGLGRLLKMIYPPASTGETRTSIRILQYDGNGNPMTLEHRSDTSGAGFGVQWTQAYDSRNRLTSRSVVLRYPDRWDPRTGAPGPEFRGTNHQEFTFDDLGRMVHALDRSPVDGAAQDIVVANTFDTGGRLLQEDQQQWVAEAMRSHVVASRYDLDGFRAELDYPSPPDGSPLYSLWPSQDAAGRLLSVEGPRDSADPGSGGSRTRAELVHYTYVGSQVWSRRSGNGAELQFHDAAGASLYDGLGRVIGVRTVDANHAGVDVTDFR